MRLLRRRGGGGAGRGAGGRDRPLGRVKAEHLFTFPLSVLSDVTST